MYTIDSRSNRLTTENKNLSNMQRQEIYFEESFILLKNKFIEKS